MKAVVITPGMANKVLTGMNARLICTGCGLIVPKYRGKYPSKCPSCQGELALAESCREDVYQKMVEDFSILIPQLCEKHAFQKEAVRKDLLIQAGMAYLFPLAERGLTEELLEGSYTLTFPAVRKPVGKVSSIIEGALSTTDPTWNYLAAKAVGLCPESIVEESLLRDIVNVSRRLHRQCPSWLPTQEGFLSQDRQRQLVSESYAYARSYLSHDEAVEYAKEALLMETLWLTAMVPPSSVLNRRKPGEFRQTIGGFRFQIKDKPRTKFRELQLRLLSQKNRSGGKASRLNTAKKMLQRRRALKKATKWHKTDPNSPRLHKGVGRLLHRSKGMYQPTQEGYRELRHIRESENSLRLFLDGTPYYLGECYFFEIHGPLLENLIRTGMTFVTRDEMIAASKISGGRSLRLPAGSNVKVTNMIKAEEWGGDYPSPPTGQYIIEVEVLEGLEKGAFVEFDGSDFARGVGLEEGVTLSTEVKESDHTHGGIYLKREGENITEVVISVYESLLSEAQLGALLRSSLAGQVLKGTPIRVYNDAPDYELLQEEIGTGLPGQKTLLEVRQNYILARVDEETEYAKEKKKLRQRYAKERDTLHSKQDQEVEDFWQRKAREHDVPITTVRSSPKYRKYRKLYNQEFERLMRRHSEKGMRVFQKYQGDLARLRDKYKVKTWESINEQEDEEERKARQMQKKEEIARAKEAYQAQIETIRASSRELKAEQMRQIRSALKSELERIERRYEESIQEADVYAGGPGKEELSQELMVKEPSTRAVIKLLPGTRVNRKDNQVLVLSGPYSGKMFTVGEGATRKIQGLQQIFEYYRGIS